MSKAAQLTNENVVAAAKHVFVAVDHKQDQDSFHK